MLYSDRIDDVGLCFLEVLIYSSRVIGGHLYTQFEPFCLLVPPAISSHQKEYVVAVDKPVSLLCESEGFPPPDITWHKDGQALAESIRQRILNSGALQIAFAQPDDAGQYTCMAANAAGSSSVSTTLTVHGRWCNMIYFHLLYHCGDEKRSSRTNVMEVKTRECVEKSACVFDSQVCVP